MLYVIGAPQALHFQMVFETARKAGWLPDDVEVVHVQIGNVLGPDGKILRTRSGEPIRLMDLLDEAVERAEQVLAESRPELDAAMRARDRQDVGIGAVKYADLSVSHDSEYTFDFDRMLSLTGNTGPYLQYAAARIRSILRKAPRPGHCPGRVVLAEEAERALALALLGFGDVVAQVGDDAGAAPALRLPLRAGPGLHHVLRGCPVLRADDAAVRASRSPSARSPSRSSTPGLGLLGITRPRPDVRRSASQAPASIRRSSSARSLHRPCGRPGRACVGDLRARSR